MHYHYFTLEQRHVLAELMRSRLGEPGMDLAIERLRTPDFRVCEVCGADIPFARVAADPTLRRCRQCD